MAQNLRNQLFDKDIIALKPKESRYRKVVGNPKKLYLIVYPTGGGGVKTFFALRKTIALLRLKTSARGYIA